ncbi:FRG domain-containing protein [Pandoraea anapnoica]|uniref:FRG domain-containing protein n=1 Tax=Pandoraea anapnoica TaxID=2508301 RepID=A0A5E5A5C6_9BURK|nr:FRG domain-containing protein [Pandoraea anapnoica]VVE68851.1 FRG domain-containing protein [Pandoraea anapnoica]
MQNTEMTAPEITKQLVQRASTTIEMKMENWREFETKLSELSSVYDELERSLSGRHLPHLLFRGQSNARFELSTTLERYPVKIIRFSDYYDAIFGARYEIESASHTTWEMPAPHEIKDALESSIPSAPPAYEYMLYLRHHGFPSPILDWSRSPYIAAFFAFSGCAQDQTDDVAIYAYLESVGSGKASSPIGPTIATLGPYARTHRRHYLQQAEYTMCRAFVGDDWHFAQHESAMGQVEGQDILFKFELPASERSVALGTLDKFNLNAWSLYGSEEGLMETMAMRQFEFSERVRRTELRQKYESERAHRWRKKA